MEKRGNYIFQSERLGFRNWQEEDIESMAAINKDEHVMEFFPAPLTTEQTTGFIKRMQELFAEKGYCYFAVDLLYNSEFIGFIGLSDPAYEAPFTPCVDIGWRLKTNVWNKGFATEGATRCLDFAFTVVGLEKVYATAPLVNLKSQRVMEKIGMTRLYEFEHPRLIHDPRLKNCIVYEKEK